MKKIISVFLAIFVLVSLASCSGNMNTVKDPKLNSAIKKANNWVEEAGEGIKDSITVTGSFNENDNTYTVVMQSKDEDTDFKLTHETYDGQFKQYPQSMFEKLSSFFADTDVKLTVTLNESNGDQIYCFADSN